MLAMMLVPFGAIVFSNRNCDQISLERRLAWRVVAVGLYLLTWSMMNQRNFFPMVKGLIAPD